MNLKFFGECKLHSELNQIKEQINKIIYRTKRLRSKVSTWHLFLYSSKEIYHFTIFDLRDVSYDDFRHFDLDHLPSSHHGELLLLLNAALEAAELLLFAPVIEGRDQDHTHHR